MANPKLENGFTRIANELLEALCRLKVSGREMRILLFIIRKTYGYNKESAKISLSDISNGVGMTKYNVSKAVKNLGTDNILIIKKNIGQTPQIISINKNYELWKTIENDNSTVVENDNLYLYKERYKE